jgi:CheY-like chemotaxis protein
VLYVSSQILHFNVKKKREIDYSPSSFIPLTNVKNDNDFESNRLVLLDTMRIDNHSRLTLTKRVKNVVRVEPGDFVIVYQDKYSKNLLFRVQRGNNVVDDWIVKHRKGVIGIANYTTSATDTNSQKMESNVSDAYPNNPIPSKIPNIMLVDDEKDVLYSFEEILADQGYNVRAFTQSKEAVKHLVELSNPSPSFSSSYRHHYDLAIIDIRMPHINGIQLYQIVRILDKNMKVLFVSALEAAEEITSIFPDLKLDQIMKKPFSYQDFIIKVKETIAFSFSFISLSYLTTVIGPDYSNSFLVDLMNILSAVTSY